MSWIYIIIAAFFEAIWVYCVKYIKWEDIKKLPFSNLSLIPQYLISISPLIGYIVFGVLNVFFFSMAMRTISASIALAVWMGVSLIFVKIIDVFYLNEPVSPLQFICIVLIVLGAIGLKNS